MEKAAQAIGEAYGCAVLCKGGHNLNDANDLLWRDGTCKWFHGRRIHNPNTHGTGCTLSSAIASNLAKGYDLDTAVERAKAYLSGALAAMLDLGAGQGPMISPIVTGIFTVGYLAVTLWLCRGVRLDARSLALGGITCALTLVLASLYIPLPTGSTITAGSMLPLMLLAVVYDYRLSFLTGWITGILALFLIPTWQPVHWAQIFVEHLVCFSCLGYAGIFGGGQKRSILLGMALAIFLKFTGHVLSGVVFFSQNAWDGWGAWAYSLTYHLTSKVPEGIATGAILLALPVTLFKKMGKAGASA